MEQAVIAVILASPVLAVGSSTLLRLRTSRPWATGLLVAAVVIAGLWLAAFVLAATGHRDADGFIDCHPACSTLQTSVGVTLFWGGVILLLIAVTALGAVVAGRSKPADRR